MYLFQAKGPRTELIGSFEFIFNLFIYYNLMAYLQKKERQKNSHKQGRSQKKLMTEAMSMEDL